MSRAASRPGRASASSSNDVVGGGTPESPVHHRARTAYYIGRCTVHARCGARRCTCGARSVHDWNAAGRRALHGPTPPSALRTKNPRTAGRRGRTSFLTVNLTLVRSEMKRTTCLQSVARRPHGCQKKGPTPPNSRCANALWQRIGSRHATLLLVEAKSCCLPPPLNVSPRTPSELRGVP
jgi:hypothetical protein